jgi:hypothetical protein
MIIWSSSTGLSALGSWPSGRQRPPAGASATPSAWQAVTFVGTDRLTGICPLADHRRFTEGALLAVYCLAHLALSSPTHSLCNRSYHA